MRKKNIPTFILAAFFAIVLSFGIVTGTTNDDCEVSVTFTDSQLLVVDGVVMMPASAFEQLGFEVEAWESTFFGEIEFNGELRDFGDGINVHTMILGIDYIWIALHDGNTVARIGYWAYLTQWDAINIASRSVILDVTPRFAANIPSRELTAGSDGFMQISREISGEISEERGELMLPIRSIVEVAGFEFDFDEQTQAVTITRSANPELDEDNQMTTLFELANSPELPLGLSLHWNPEIRRLEARR